MKQIGIISDTHGFVHPECFSFFKECAEIWHAGDLGNCSVIDELSLIAPLKAVYGNCDGWDIRPLTSKYLVFQCEAVKVAMMHIVGYPNHYEKEALQLIQIEKPELLIAGHSHILRVMQDMQHNLLFINPGAGGIYGIHTHTTFIRMKIDNKKMFDLEVFDEKKENK